MSHRHPRAPLALLFCIAVLFACDGAEPEPGSEEGRGPAPGTAGGASAASLGTLRFDTGCERVAADHAARGLALLHHMTYLDAREAFVAATETDPGCTMGYWGQAMTIIHPLWPDVPDRAGLETGSEIVARAKEHGVSSDRAGAYLATVEAYFRDGTARTESERLASFDEAWRAVFERFPDDLEARSLYALARLGTVSPEDKTYGRQYEALDLLDDVLEAIPDHPGAQHYTIHARDYPPLALEALDVARAYGRLAPDIPHALHMPTHIYTRVGHWDESIDGNERSVESSWTRGQRMGGITTDFHHALDYLAYAHLQRAEDEKARQIMDRALAADGPWAAVNMPAIAYALAAIPARFALERRDWAAAAELTPGEPAGFPWDDRFAPFMAVTQFAKALGGARGGRPEAARAAIEVLSGLSDQISQTASDVYWQRQVEVQLLASRAWLAFETGDREDGLRAMREAAALEARTEKHAVTPGEVVPASELLGEMLLLAERPGEALVAFETALARSPGRLNGLAGAARAAAGAGRRDLAADYYRQLLELTAEADTEREAMTEARAFLADR